MAIVGENGAGKSTIIKLVLGLYEPSSGSVEIDGRDLREWSVESWHGQLALLNQEFDNYEFANIKENIALGDVNKRPDDELIDRAITDAELGVVVNRLPSGKESYIEKWMVGDAEGATGTELSGGQQQRLALARNFYRNSPVIILDEPTSAIDALAESRIFARLFSKKKKTTIVVSHRLTVVEQADRIYMIKDGEVVEMGSHRELVRQKGHYYRMFESQIR